MKGTIGRNLDRSGPPTYSIGMVRTIIKPGTPRINLSIPAEYVGMEVEILVFPVNSTLEYKEAAYNQEENRIKRQEAYQNFMKYRGSLPADFDYEKELTEYRDQRYGHID